MKTRALIAVTTAAIILTGYWFIVGYREPASPEAAPWADSAVLVPHFYAPPTLGDVVGDLWDDWTGDDDEPSEDEVRVGNDLLGVDLPKPSLPEGKLALVLTGIALLVGAAHGWKAGPLPYDPPWWREASKAVHRGARWALVTSPRSLFESRGQVRKWVVVFILAPTLIMWHVYAGVALAALCWWKGRRREWWRTGDMARHLHEAGVYVGGAGMFGVNPVEPPRLPRHVEVEHGEHGITATVYLPAGVAPSKVAEQHERLASSLKVEAERLHIDAPDMAAGNVVRLHVAHTAAARDVIGSGRQAAVVGAVSTKWADGVPLGRDPRGEDVVFRSDGVHTLICGSPNSGKSRLARIPIATALLDPDVKVWAISGKGEAADWQSMEPACEGFVGTVDEHMPGLALDICQDALAHARARSAESLTKGRAAPSAVLLVEEWAAVRTITQTVGSKKLLEELDQVMGLLLSTSRAAGLHIILVTQTPLSESFPSAQRDQVVQRCVMRMTRAQTVEIGLGTAPTNPAPTRAGQALVLHDELPETSVLVDDVPDAAWEAICAKAAELRDSPVEPLHVVPDIDDIDPDVALFPEEKVNA